MRGQRVAHEKYSEEVDEMNTEERLGRLEVKVEHLQSDLTEVKTDVREVKKDVRDLRETMHAFVLGLEKFKWRFWAALVVLSVLQLLVAGGAPAAIMRAFKLP